jgi:3-oxoacyl-[acyl-carrier protein] reductase
MKGKTAIVIGGSRGIGAAAVEMFGRRGAEVVFTYSRKFQRAQQLLKRLCESGATTCLRQLDICDHAAIAHFVAELSAGNTMFDFLVLAAAGGLEPGRGPDYASKINEEAPAALVRGILPRARDGAVIIFLTSHEAHFFGTQPTYEGYAPIAASKHAGEQRLKALAHLMQARGVQLNVISGDIVPETATGKLLEYKDPGLLERRRAAVGQLPSVYDIAERIELLCDRPLNTFGEVSFVWDPVGYTA